MSIRYRDDESSLLKLPGTDAIKFEARVFETFYIRKNPGKFPRQSNLFHLTLQWNQHSIERDAR